MSTVAAPLLPTTSRPSSRSAATETRTLLKLAAPIAAAQVGQSLMGFVDTAVVGRAGAVPLAAVGLSNALIFAVSVFGIGLMMGLDTVVSQALGAGMPRRAKELYWQGNWLGAGVGLVLMSIVALMPLLMGPLGIEEAVRREAAAYIWFRAPSLLPLLWFIGARSYLQAVGRPGALVVSTIVANIFNLGLSVLLVFGGAGLPEWLGLLHGVPAMGAVGAAIATTGSVSLELFVVSFAIRKERVEGGPVRLRPVPADIHKVARLGLPVALHVLAEVFVFALAGLLAGRMGASSVAAHQVAITLASLTFCVALGFGNAGSVRVGKAVGAGDTPGARFSGLVAFTVGGTFMAFAAVTFLLFPEALAGLVTSDPEVLKIAVPLLGVAAAWQLSDGIQGVGAGVLRGAGDSRFTFTANLVGHYAIGLPVALLLGPVLGGGIRGIWWGLCLGLTAVAVALVARFLWLSSREIRSVFAAEAAGAG